VRIHDIVNKRTEWKGIKYNDVLLRDALGYLIPFPKKLESESIETKTIKGLIRLQTCILSCFQDFYENFDPFTNEELEEVSELDFRGLPLHSSPLIQCVKSDALTVSGLSIDNIDFSQNENRTQWLFYLSESLGVTIDKINIQGVQSRKDLDVFRIGENVKKLSISDFELHGIDSLEGTICGIVKADSAKVEDIHIVDYRYSGMNSIYLVQPIHCPNKEQHPISFSINPTQQPTQDSKTMPPNSTPTTTPKGITFTTIPRPPVNLLGTIKSRQ
jgi:hypothetical protein